MDNDLVQAALLVIAALDAMQIPYFVGGSLASAAYGLQRSTLDVDLVADIHAEHVARFVSLLAGPFHVDEAVIRESIEQRTSFNLIHQESITKIDVFVPRHRDFDHSQFARRIRQMIQETPEVFVYVASPEDTILSKLEWYRRGNEASDRQWKDILGILKVQAGRLDVNYMRRWAADLNVADLLERAFDDSR